MIDSNDSPPICESPSYRASIDEGATEFDPPLIIKARDPDVASTINYRIIGNDAIQKLFSINNKTGQLSVTKSGIIDVNYLKSENIFFTVEVNYLFKKINF